jgi:uncharacterized protein (TIGR01777 family)
LSNANYEIIVLSRNIEFANKIFGEKVTPVSWDGKSAAGWLDHIDGAHAIINLAGENIGSSRWTQKKKQRMLESRLQAGKAIVAAIRQVKTKPEVLLQASGIGIYGDRRDGLLDETASPGRGFMPEVARDWEQSVKEVAEMEVRLVYLRTGVVLAKEADFIKRVLLPFRLFVGGHLGSGKQWLSWIHLEDEVRAIKYLLERKDLTGAINLSAPNPLTYKDFFKTLGNVMNRPSWFHVPGFLLKLVLGEMADGLILTGQRAIPKKLSDAGFEFNYPEIETALKEILS